MTTRNPEARGATSQRLMRDVLIEELNERGEGPAGHYGPKIHLLARALVDQAVEGDLPSIKEIFDRVDGRAGPAEQSAAGGLTFEERLKMLK